MTTQGQPHVARSLGVQKQQTRLPLGDTARRQLVATLPVTERRLQLAGISTAVLEGGEGRPMLLLHGPGAYAAHWLRMLPALVRSHRVIAPDLPGHGTSEIIDGRLDAERVLAWLGELIAQTCTSPPVLVGHLVGGAIAARYAARNSNGIAHLVLIDTFGLSAFEPTAEFAAALNRFLAQPDERTHEMLWEYCARDLTVLQEAMGERWTPFTAYNLDRARAPSAQAALGALMHAFAAPIPTAELAKIAVPATLIWGRHDLATPLAVAEMASTRYGWPLHVIDDSNDAPPIEQPEVVLHALRAALGTSTQEAKNASAPR